MSIFKVNGGDVETFTVVTHPIRHYTSSSTMGSTGSVHVFARRSDIEKDVTPTTAFQETTHQDSDISTAIRDLQNAAKMSRLVPSSDLSGTLGGMMQAYLTKVDQQSRSSRKQKTLDVIRFTPSFQYTSNTGRKAAVKDVLQRYYRTSYPTAHWAYTNYNTLNFFTASSMPTSSVLLYPNVPGPEVHTGFVSGGYVPSGSFTFDFYVNPRYQPDSEKSGFKASCLLHLSSTYAVSLITGSSKDVNGLANGFRIQLQLSHSADISPSLALPGNFPKDLVFQSSDNSLKWNNWHHIIVRWGTNLTNAGTGSFVVDGIERGTFVVPSSTIAPRLYNNSTSGPDVLCVGNYWEGTNKGLSSQACFFATDPATREGLQPLFAQIGVETPLSFSFNHPFKGEVHDVALKRYYMSDLDIVESASVGPKSLDDWTAFYLPPFFVEESPFRKFVGTFGGILQTPFFEVDGTTNDPFNVAMSFGVGGHYINIENFVRDFAANVFPRAHHLSASAITTSTNIARGANEFLYDQRYVRARNLLVMPCDDGLFVPSFELLASESMRSNAVDDMNVEELSFINMKEMIATGALFGTDFGEDYTFLKETIGPSPETPGSGIGPAYKNYIRNVALAVASGTFDPGVQDGAPLTIYQRTGDPSSNQVTFFDISNLYYGLRIFPGSFVLKDSSFSSSAGTVSITLKDDGKGNIYRGDCLTSQSSWNSVGNIYYDEGIVVIKSPHLYFFGKEGYDVSFRGEQHIHVMRLDVQAPANQLNSSSNPNFVALPPSGYPNDPDKNFVYITSLNFHDDNFNVIMKTQLAQPILKREGDRVNFQIKYDF